jgi:hypothetical protein
VANTILASPGLGVEHCDRLIKVLLRHEASPSDGYAQGLRAEYLTARASLRDIVQKQPLLAARTPIDGRSRLVRELNDYYRTLLGLDGLPYAGRLDKIARLKITEGGDPFSRMVAMTVPAVLSFVQAMGRTSTTLHATECLIVMRRWQLTHRGLPRTLTVAAKEAGFKAVPTDPYDGQPMRTAVLEGRPIVYSVGKDGRDDGGQKDSKYDTQPGDLIYRMPSAEAGR